MSERQVWEITKGEHAGSHLTRGANGGVSLIRDLSPEEVERLVDHRALTPLRPHACRDPWFDLLRRRDRRRRFRRHLRHLKAI